MQIDDALRFLDIVIWPSVAVAALLVFRKPLSQLLRLVARVRFKDLDIKFGKELDSAEEATSTLPPPPRAGEPDSDSVAKLIDASPEAAVLEAWKRVEHSARNKVQELLPPGEEFQRPVVRPVDYLDYKGALTPTVAKVARDLRMLRNQAAHVPSGGISKADALRYVEIAGRVRSQIEGIRELPRVKLTALTFLILQLNSAIDSGRHQDITIDEVYGWIERREVLTQLARRVGSDIDLSLFGSKGPYLRFSEFYHDTLYAIWEGYEGKHRRKWGVENSGLCLLLAWTNEIVQQGSGWYPDTSWQTAFNKSLDPTARCARPLASRAAGQFDG